MPRSLLERVFLGVSGNVVFFQRYHAAKHRGISPLMRVIAELSVLAYRKGFDEDDEIFGGISILSARNLLIIYTGSRRLLWPRIPMSPLGVLSQTVIGNKCSSWLPRLRG